MLSFSDVACRRDGNVLFEQASFVVQRGHKLGLTGANGTGKSSLFAMIQGTLEADSGVVSLQNQVGITHVAQETPSTGSRAIDHVLDGDRTLRGIEAEIEAAVHTSTVSDFSGGWRMRLNLAQALMSPAELLLLDEPTNHLDHDREFLDAVTSHTLHIEAGQVTLITGNYSAFETWRAARRATDQATHEKTERRRRELESFVTRFRAKATKARQAQSRLKMLERLGETEAMRPDSPFKFRFRAPDRLPNPLVLLDNVNLGYGGKPVLEKVRFAIDSGERIGLLGVNGAGKSTLVKALVGDLEPLAGERVPAEHLAVGYFAQHQVDQLDGQATAYTTLRQADASLDETAVRTWLGTFGFVADQVHQRIGTLSGGERARLALALIVHAKPNLLLLDEPTNHLDIDMRAALAEALNGFNGGLVVISHDRTLLRGVVDELFLVADGQVSVFDDDLDGYARWLSRRRSETVEPVISTPANAQSVQSTVRVDVHQASAGASGEPVPRSTADRDARKRAEAAQRSRLAPLKRAVEKAERALECRRWMMLSHLTPFAEILNPFEVAMYLLTACWSYEHRGVAHQRAVPRAIRHMAVALASLGALLSTLVSQAATFGSLDRLTQPEFETLMTNLTCTKGCLLEWTSAVSSARWQIPTSRLLAPSCVTPSSREV